MPATTYYVLAGGDLVEETDDAAAAEKYARSGFEVKAVSA